ncbi:MAG: ABC transporter substrate-binding protein, partial [Saprospiraceae bacterium]|nr:ABC transporter substrate-binding protein [Saprospiraceae bacterium]
VSPESPNEDLTNQNPGFLQFNPSLRSHCEAITRDIRRTHRPEQVVLVCKQKEAERLSYFQNQNAALGGARFTELVVPDATTNFDNANLASYLRAGRTTVFVLPSWSSQDFVMAFLRKLRAVKGSSGVEVYGMPQWLGYENIEPEFYSALNVKIPTPAFIDYQSPEVMEFQQAFYEAYGTLPDEDAFNGYDVTLFTGKMLRKYGLSFPEKISREQFRGLRTRFQFSPVYKDSNPDTNAGRYDYLENKFVFILKFQNGRFVPSTE